MTEQPVGSGPRRSNDCSFIPIPMDGFKSFLFTLWKKLTLIELIPDHLGLLPKDRMPRLTYNVVLSSFACEERTQGELSRRLTCSPGAPHDSSTVWAPLPSLPAGRLHALNHQVLLPRWLWPFLFPPSRISKHHRAQVREVSSCPA